MLFHADMRIIGLRRRGAEQDQCRLKPRVTMRLINQFFADTLFLYRPVDGEVGQIRTKRKIAEAARDAEQKTVAAIAAGHDNIRPIAHHLQAGSVIRRPARIEPRPDQDITEFQSIEPVFTIIEQCAGQSVDLDPALLTVAGQD
jgi:hypothetical protein